MALAVALTAGCTTIDAHKAAPTDWPRLQVVEHEVSTIEMLKHCYPALSPLMKLVGSVPIACAWINMEKRLCDIYRTAWTPRLVVEHEYEHCGGRDHVGATTLADLWSGYKAAGGR